LTLATGETEERMFLLEGFRELANLPLGGLSTLTLLKVVKKFCSSVRTYKQSGGSIGVAPKHLRNKVEFATIHSLLGLTAEIDNEGHETLNLSRDDKRASFAAFDIVLIDEASMINNELWGCCKRQWRGTQM